MDTRPIVEVELTLLPEAEGGRATPPAFAGMTYRPHIVIGDPRKRVAEVGADGVTLQERYLGVAFQAGPDSVTFGQPFRAEAVLVYFPDADYAQVTPGASFTLREGSRIIGHGRVTGRRVHQG